MGGNRFQNYMTQGDICFERTDYSGAIEHYRLARLDDSHKQLASEKLSWSYFHRAKESLPKNPHLRLPEASRHDFIHTLMCARVSTNIKVSCLAAEAALRLDLIYKAKEIFDTVLEMSPNDEDLKNLSDLITAWESNYKKDGAAFMAAKDLASAIEDRQLKIGSAHYEHFTNLRPKLDGNVIRWPVLLRHHGTDVYIDSVAESDTVSSLVKKFLSEHDVFSPEESENRCNEDDLVLYCLDHDIRPLEGNDVIRFLYQGTTDFGLDVKFNEQNDKYKGLDTGTRHYENPDAVNYTINDVDTDVLCKEYASETVLERMGQDDEPEYEETVPISDEDNKADTGSRYWFQVNKEQTLGDALKENNLLIPGIPVFHVLLKSEKPGCFPEED